jgi:hypothetical protein
MFKELVINIIDDENDIIIWHLWYNLWISFLNLNNKNEMIFLCQRIKGISNIIN